MRLVAVVPCWNASDRLVEVLAALDGQVGFTVVVDNHSGDGSLDVARAALSSGEVLALPTNQGYAAAVNLGIERARRLEADGVLLVNDDAVFADGAVRAMWDALTADPGAGAVSAKMHYRHRPGVLNGSGGEWRPERAWAALRGAGEVDRGQYDQARLVHYPSGAASVLRMTTLEQVGGMDERFYLYFEDADWGLRAARIGWRTLYQPDALVIHVGSAGTAERPERRRYYNVRNRLLLASKHAPAAGRARAWAETLGLLARQPARWVWPRRRADAGAVAAGVADHLIGRYGRSKRFG